MVPELSAAFGLSAVGVASLVGLFYYAYAPFSLGAIGDSGEAQRLIRTIARKGVRFVGAVTEIAEPARINRPTIGGDRERVAARGTFLHRSGRRTDRVRRSRSRITPLEDRPLDDAPGIRLGEPGLETAPA